MEPIFERQNISIATAVDIIHTDDDVNIYPVHVYVSGAIIFWGNYLNWTVQTVVSDNIFGKFLVKLIW